MRATGGSAPAYLYGVAGSPGGIRRRRAGSPMSAGASGERCGARATCRFVPAHSAASARVRRTGRASGLGSPVESCSPWISRRGYQQRWQLLPLSRALQRPVAVRVVTVRGPAIGGCERGPEAPAAISSLACGAVPRHRAGRGHPRCCHPRVRSGPAGSAVLASLTCDAALCLRAGRGH